MGQSYRDLEIIVIDDGSTDSSFEMCKKLESEDGRITVIHQENAGVSAARNRGLEVAQGEYVTFVDADDLLLEDAFLDISTNADLVIYDAVMRKGRKAIHYLSSLQTSSLAINDYDLARAVVLQDALGFVWGNLYRKDFLDRNDIRFNMALIQGEDNDFNFRVVAHRPITEYIHRPIYQYNYCTSTSRKRWCQDADLMIANSESRYRRKLDFIREFYPEHYDDWRMQLTNKQINGVFYNALDLCGSSKLTPQRAKRIIEMMREIEMPPLADIKTKCEYLLVLNGRWHFIKMFMFARELYHRIMNI